MAPILARRDTSHIDGARTPGQAHAVAEGEGEQEQEATRLIGRDTEVERLLSLAHIAQQGSAQMVLLTGE